MVVGRRDFRALGTLHIFVSITLRSGHAIRAWEDQLELEFLAILILSSLCRSWQVVARRLRPELGKVIVGLAIGGAGCLGPSGRHGIGHGINWLLDLTAKLLLALLETRGLVCFQVLGNLLCEILNFLGFHL